MVQYIMLTCVHIVPKNYRIVDNTLLYRTSLRARTHELSEHMKLHEVDLPFEMSYQRNETST